MGKLPVYLAGLGVLACGLGASGGAAATGAETVWTCWYDGSTTVLCRLVSAPLPTAGADARVSWVEPVILRTARPLPAIVHMISQDPARFASRTVRIPLHNHAHNMDAVEQLADAVMCGGRSDCRVHFERG